MCIKFVVVKNYDIGLKTPLRLYNENQKEVVLIHDVSSIARLLDLSYDTFPQFFIYVLKTDRYKNEFIDINIFCKRQEKKLRINLY